MGHINELFDFTVTAYIVMNKKVLFVDHISLGTWMPPGGHIELDEDPMACLWREMEEETGINRKDLELIQPQTQRFSPSTEGVEVPMPFDIRIFDVTQTHRHIDLTYILRAKEANVLLSKSEHKDIKWFDINEIETNKSKMFDSVYQFSKEALAIVASRDKESHKN
jgi:ADP-ribose pyrophosphatase YjhB (NUDIX family)